MTKAKTLAAGAAALALAGCAKVPPGAGGLSTKQVTFSFTMNAPVNPSFVYMVALNPTNDPNPTTQGPIPVVAPPWGNGFVAGNCQYFIRWDLTQPVQQQCVIYQFASGSLINYFPLAVPISFNVSPDNTTLTCELDLAQIASSVAAANAYQTLQVNFLTMDKVPTGNAGSKTWDALGDSRIPSQINTWLNIPLRSSGTYTDASYGNIEPTGDCPDPTLDISNFSVQVTAQ